MTRYEKLLLIVTLVVSVIFCVGCRTSNSVQNYDAGPPFGLRCPGDECGVTK